MRSLVPIVALGLLAAGCQDEQSAERQEAATRPAHGRLSRKLASRFAGLSLACTVQPWPNKPGHVYTANSEMQAPQVVTPAFYGCFDWHSAVHGHWALLRLLERFPDLPEAPAIRARLNVQLTADNLKRELSFFDQERSATFERPYGWGWFLRLYAEAAGFDDPDGRRWKAALEPLAAHLSAGLRAYLAKLSVPCREGTHPNTAFALAHALDAARATGDQALERAVVRRARDFYGRDRACPTGYEPSGEDFLSPCLTEADLMRRVLPAGEFARWLDGFLPPVESKRFAPLRTPVEVRDRQDPRIGHLIGLAFQRAWCFEGIARALPAGDARVAAFLRLARRHRRAGLKQMFDSGYGGTHWLATFAIYLTTGAGLPAD